MSGIGRAVDPLALLGVNSGADGLAFARLTLVIGIGADLIVGAFGDVIILVIGEDVAEVVFENLAQMVPIGVRQLSDLKKINSRNKLGVAVRQRNVLNLFNQIVHHVNLLI